MTLIYFSFTILLIIINLIGVALWLRAYLPHYLLAKVVGVIGLCLSAFFIEHFVGLGQLSWVWPISTGLSLVLIYRNRKEFFQGLWRQELVFVIALLCFLAWKFTFPDIDPHSEQLTDLAFIVSYQSGHTLPPQDYWDPQLRLNMYYTFQHYAASLLGRVFNLSPGLTMNMAIALILAMLAGLGWFIVSQYNRQRWARVLMVIAIMVGGTGIAPLTHIIFNQAKPGQDHAYTAKSNIWANARFIGMYDQSIDTPLGSALFHATDAQTPTRDLPLETIGYLTFLGDFHPPLGGLLLLFISLACLSLLNATTVAPSHFLLESIFAACVPLTLITNTWIFPLQAALLLGWLVHRYVHKTPPDWRAVMFGLAGSLVCIYPFLSQFAAHALHPHIKWIGALDHTPWDRFIAVHWPELVLLLLAGVGFRRDRNKFWLVILFAVLLLCTELFYVDDPLQGKYNRFNSTLKWWSWLYPAMLLMLGSWLLAVGRWYRWVSVAVLVLVSTFSVDMLGYWYYSDKPSLGKLNGHYWLSRNPVNNTMLQWLEVMPTGVVLEGIDSNGAYTRTSAFALFASKPSALGWPEHETEWRADPGIIYRNADMARRFYRGELSDPIAWLNFNNIRYIVWTEHEQARAPRAREQINKQIQAEFYWLPFSIHGNAETGIWFRRSNLANTSMSPP